MDVLRERLINKVLKIGLVLFAVLMLVSAYVTQNVDWLGSISSRTTKETDPSLHFIFNKTFRLFINDTACLILIYVFFQKRKYLNMAFALFVVELLVILPFYLLIKLTLEGDTEISSPLLSQIHRLIVNPTLMFLLMLGFVYQRLQQNNSKT
jgi:exosortase F-associated protein